VEREAAFFNVGDIITFGKYKNKKGRIISFGENPKGQPTVEIEPIPKGRKQNKTMGLFKIWQPAAIPPKEGSAVNLRVAARYLEAALGVGRTLDDGSVRIHRYRDHLRVTDLTNAGKRGKKVESFTASPTYSYDGDPQKWLNRISKLMIQSYRGNYLGMFGLVKDLKHDFPTEVEINEHTERGIDVTPSGGKLKIQGEDWSGSAEPQEFLLSHKAPLTKPGQDKPYGFQDTLYWARKRKDAMLFYGWLKDNQAKLRRMDITQLRSLWDKLGVHYESH